MTWIMQYFQIDLSTFLTLTDRDLRELGISTFGARRKMLLAIAGTYHCDSCQRVAYTWLNY